MASDYVRERNKINIGVFFFFRESIDVDGCLDFRLERQFWGERQFWERGIRMVLRKQNLVPLLSQASLRLSCHPPYVPTSMVPQNGASLPSLSLTFTRYLLFSTNNEEENDTSITFFLSLEKYVTKL